MRQIDRDTDSSQTDRVAPRTNRQRDRQRDRQREIQIERQLDMSLQIEESIIDIHYCYSLFYYHYYYYYSLLIFIIIIIISLYLANVLDTDRETDRQGCPVLDGWPGHTSCTGQY